MQRCVAGCAKQGVGRAAPAWCQLNVSVLDFYFFVPSPWVSPSFTHHPSLSLSTYLPQGSEKLSDEANDETLDKVVKLLAYISDKDLPPPPPPNQRQAKLHRMGCT